MKKIKKVYIVLTHSGTALSQLIKNYTRDEFSHVSLSLDRDLNEMYSFGRINPYNPFWGGFVHEYTYKGTFKRFYNTRTKVYDLEVTDEQYEIIKETINEFKGNKDKYTFNIIGLLAVGFHKRIHKEKSFYCAEFIKYLLEKASIVTDLPDMIRPEDFKSIKGIHEIYGGLLRKYDSLN